MRRGCGQKKLVALDIGTLTNEKLVFRAGMLGESVVGLDDGAGRVAGVQVPARVARRWRQNTGKVSDMAMLLVGIHTTLRQEVCDGCRGFKVSGSTRCDAGVGWFQGIVARKVRGSEPLLYVYRQRRRHRTLERQHFNHDKRQVEQQMCANDKSRQ